MSLVADRESFGSEAAHTLLKSLAAQGVDAISIVVHGIAPQPQGHRESHEEIELLTRRAHLLGMKVMLKPHHRPRAADMASAEARTRWIAKHGSGIEEFGRLASRIHADLFCIGYELGKAYQYEAEWRIIVQRARSVYPGPLTEVRINTTSMAPVASVFASRAIATFPPARRSPMMPEPTTVARRNAVPSASAVSFRTVVICSGAAAGSTARSRRLRCTNKRAHELALDLECDSIDVNSFCS